MAEKKRLTFAPYDLKETDDDKRQSATAFAQLRQALKSSDGKPDAPEQPGSWERTANLHRFFSRGEYRHIESVFNPNIGGMVDVPMIVLNPAGYTGVVTVETVALLQSLWTEHVKKHGTRAMALYIAITNDWLAKYVTDADDEAAVKTGLVAVDPIPGKGEDAAQY